MGAKNVTNIFVTKRVSGLVLVGAERAEREGAGVRMLVKDRAAKERECGRWGPRPGAGVRKACVPPQQDSIFGFLVPQGGCPRLLPSALAGGPLGQQVWWAQPRPQLQEAELASPSRTVPQGHDELSLLDFQS